MSNRIKALATASITALLLLAAGCGDDEETSTVDEYCERSRVLNEQEGTPSDEDLDELADLAPNEIADEVHTLVQALKDGDEEALQRDDVQDASAAVQQFEAENCDASTDATDDEGVNDADTNDDEGDDESGTVTTDETDDASTTTAPSQTSLVDGGADDGM